MREKEGRTALDRRNFLKAGLGAGGATAAVAVGTAVPAKATESDVEKTKARYRETDHVKAFYRTNRY